MRFFILALLTITTLCSYDLSRVPPVSREGFLKFGGAIIDSYSADTETYSVVLILPAASYNRTCKMITYFPDRADMGNSFETVYEDGKRYVQLYIRKKDLAKPVVVVAYGTDIKEIRQFPYRTEGYLDFEKILNKPKP